MSCEFEKLKEWAVEEIEEMIQSLPSVLQTKAQALPVTTEPRPSQAMCDDGIEPDTLGLFVGPDHSTDDAVPIPSQIILFLENLWDFAEKTEDCFREEVRRTYLHELGHYLGLNEDDLWDRGLD